ncbi:hypothetical protein Mth01_48820 [Sphaerimonospora thailandensis]|uniref:Uncharacterized protein n=1 Tax=Sphaerimonospora thailandensis TaxID=795644 RepID=A0A8J3RD91_9ACTN|nr:hypothetical protein Mth01_48820 [Sphaerimonospora thailandensis]
MLCAAAPPVGAGSRGRDYRWNRVPGPRVLSITPDLKVGFQEVHVRGGPERCALRETTLCHR